MNHLGLIELVLTLVIVLGFGFYQLWTVRDAGKKPDDSSAKDPRHPEG